MNDCPWCEIPAPEFDPAPLDRIVNEILDRIGQVQSVTVRSALSPADELTRRVVGRLP